MRTLARRPSTRDLNSPRTGGGGNYTVEGNLEEEMLHQKLEQAEIQETIEIDQMAPVEDVFNAKEIEIDFHFNDATSTFQVVKKLAAIVFITMEIEQSSYVAKFISLAIKMAICLAVFTFIVSTDPYFRVIPDTCAFPDCDNDPLICPGYMICQVS